MIYAFGLEKYFFMEILRWYAKRRMFCQNFRNVFSFHRQWLMTRERERERGNEKVRRKRKNLLFFADFAQCAIGYEY